MDLTQGTGHHAFTIARKLKEHGFVAYFAGGCVRDFLMDRMPHDYDIATTAPPEMVERMFAKTIPVGKQFGVVLVVPDGGVPVEVATFRKDSDYPDGRHPASVAFSGPEEDALRRDFTVNGLFYDPFESRVIDYVGGQSDLHSRIIRAIGDPVLRFREDKLRLLRAVRFASSLGFTVEPDTWKAVCAHASDIRAVSPERIREELIKIMTRSGASLGFSLLSDSGLMAEILPEIEAMKGVEQPPEFHPEGDVFIHTRILLEQLCDPSVTLAMSALLHDIGKPSTFERRENRVYFYEHASRGAKIAEEVMRRLRFSNQEIEKVKTAIENHMKFGDVQKMREGKLKQFISRPNFEEELELHRADCLASHGMLDNYRFLKAKIESYTREQLKPKPLLNGHDLMGLGMPAGPGMKPVLDEAYTLQLEGKILSREEAMAWAANQIKKILSGEGDRSGSRP